MCLLLLKGFFNNTDTPTRIGTDYNDATRKEKNHNYLQLIINCEYQSISLVTPTWSQMFRSITTATPMSTMRESWNWVAVHFAPDRIQNTVCTTANIIIFILGWCIIHRNYHLKFCIWKRRSKNYMEIAPFTFLVVFNVYFICLFLTKQASNTISSCPNQPELRCPAGDSPLLQTKDANLDKKCPADTRLVVFDINLRCFHYKNQYYCWVRKDNILPVGMYKTFYQTVL